MAVVAGNHEAASVSVYHVIFAGCWVADPEAFDCGVGDGKDVSWLLGTFAPCFVGCCEWRD